MDATKRVEARQQLDHQLALQQPGRQRQRRGGADRQVHARRHRVRGLRRRQGVGADLRLRPEQSGNYVAPSTTAASAAAAGVKVASNLTFAAVWACGATAYPITYQSWDLVYAKQPNANDATMLKAYIGYLLGAGQKLLPSLGYAPLPSSLDSMAKAQLSQITSPSVMITMAQTDQIGSLP